MPLTENWGNSDGETLIWPTELLPTLPDRLQRPSTTLVLRRLQGPRALRRSSMFSTVSVTSPLLSLRRIR